MQVDLRELIRDTEPVKFLHVAWRAPRSRLGILYYTLGGYEQEVGLRVDFDKKAVADEIENDVVAAIIASHMTQICHVVAQAQFRHELGTIPSQDLMMFGYLGG